ncbi:MAG TPA: FHA domain-containing protein [Dehalococcoidia bacterium]|nr:FHA domain-containing protein [Dehalococcoidia bacterium]
MEDNLLIIIRLTLLAILYLFLWAVLSAVWRDIRRAPQRAPATYALAGMPRLYVVEPGSTTLRQGEVIDLQPLTTLGRSAVNTLTLQDETVSARHAAVEYRDGRWWVHDLDSTNGTYVNRRRLAGTTELQPQDLLHIGRIAFQFAVETPQVYAGAARRPTARISR